MTPFRDILSRFRRETAPTERAVARVRERVGTEDSDADVSRAVLRHLPGVRPGAEARIKARLAAPAPAGTRRPLVYGGVVLAAAAAGLTVVAVMPDPGLAPVQAELAAGTQRAELQPSPEVALAYQGAGQLEGTRQAPRIAWESGTVHVDVQPEQGIDLVVETVEAQVQVVGTAFAVTRDLLGTTVEVDHGLVRVVCVDGDTVEIGAGDRHLCYPTTAHDMLVRANTLRERGAAPELLLNTAELALQRYSGTVVDEELVAVRIESLTRLERSVDAYSAAQAYLAADYTSRRDDVLRLTAKLAFDTGGCDEALPWFRQLATEQPGVATLVKLADCETPLNPDAARVALEQAQSLEPDARWAAAIEQRLEQL